MGHTYGIEVELPPQHFPNPLLPSVSSSLPPSPPPAACLASFTSRVHMMNNVAYFPYKNERETYRHGHPLPPKDGFPAHIRGNHAKGAGLLRARGGVPVDGSGPTTHPGRYWLRLRGAVYIRGGRREHPRARASDCGAVWKANRGRAGESGGARGGGGEREKENVVPGFGRGRSWIMIVIAHTKVLTFAASVLWTF